MGLFSRNESASDSGRRSASRASLSSEAQASELRGRARRRLIGALALVLAAVIVVPMLFDSSEPLDETQTPVVVPSIVPPPADGNVALAPASPEPAAPDAAAPAPGATPHDPATQPDATAQTPLPATPEPAEPVQPEPADPAPKPEPAPAPAPATEKPKPAEKPAPKPSSDRSDDGSVALALLEGRSPGEAKPAPAETKGSFILQIAAYTNEQDANVRRERLVSAGVTNAYVENASSGGKTAYRLRVGPFPSRDAAQAAQARLRALGYDNGFISTK
ncbi:SPOR domain-containing protein [Pusillimonas sp. SM2304]|uniref:SPOR domain-containing protein n=1 Tax=Pusillimonas sp. SM2304 TaxID=3073241 RepID=UPI0028743E09|nr:SPOR domain-containing protein [Pusillimonas sp. SM2304]MDS1141493.1 SPOR domain-containing protein [Pusillimonas sp. SM2304]